MGIITTVTLIPRLPFESQLSSNLKYFPISSNITVLMITACLLNLNAYHEQLICMTIFILLSLLSAYRYYSYWFVKFAQTFNFHRK